MIWHVCENMKNVHEMYFFNFFYCVLIRVQRKTRREKGGNMGHQIDTETAVLIHIPDVIHMLTETGTECNNNVQIVRMHCTPCYIHYY